MAKNTSMLGIKIKKLRKAKDIDRNKLSRLTGIDNVVLYEIESGDICSLNPNDLEKIAKALNVNVIELAGGNVNYDINIYELIRHIEHEFAINRNYLTADKKYSIVNSLKSAIDTIESSRNNFK